MTDFVQPGGGNRTVLRTPADRRALVDEPAHQAMLKRLGCAIGDINSARINRVQHVCLIAEAVLAGKARAS